MDLIDIWPIDIWTYSFNKSVEWVKNKCFHLLNKTDESNSEFYVKYSTYLANIPVDLHIL